MVLTETETRMAGAGPIQPLHPRVPRATHRFGGG